MKNKLIYSLLLLILPFTALADNCEDGDYVLSAYYSPLPGQNYYATGSYASEVILNGGGIITASGDYVDQIPYAFVAAPDCFNFGDTILVEELGYFKVLDRGGAIKGNRLDVWVGYGNSGLNTALNFGKKTLFVKKVQNVTDDQLLKSYNDLDNNLILLPKNGVYNPLEFISTLELGDSGFFVGVVQQFLKDLGLYNDEVSFKFDKKTQLALDEFKANFAKLKDDQMPPTGLNESLFLNLKNFAIHKRQEEIEYEFLYNTLLFGSENFDVLNLQKILYLLGYDLEITGKFDSETKESLHKFQIDNQISFLNSSSQGNFGAKTKRVLLQAILKNNFTSDNFDLNNFFYDPVYKDQSSVIIRSLQEFLKTAGFYKASINGKMDEITINSLRHFQLSGGIIDNSVNSGAGFFGPKTRRYVNNLLLQQINKFQSLPTSLKQIVKIEENVMKSDDLVSLVGLKYQDNHPNVEVLQQKLIQKGFLDSRYTTTYFGDKTLAALRILQTKMLDEFKVEVDPTEIDMQIHRYLMDI